MTACPLCAGPVVFVGLNSLECETYGCRNGTKDPSVDPAGWTLKVWGGLQHFSNVPTLCLWCHSSGARVAGAVGGGFVYYYPDSGGLLSPADGHTQTLEEAQRLALGGTP